MIAPLSNEGNKKLLETITLEKKVITLESIINFYLHENNLNNYTVQ